MDGRRYHEILYQRGFPGFDDKIVSMYVSSILREDSTVERLFLSLTGWQSPAAQEAR
jgi:hypothetical protein